MKRVKFSKLLGVAFAGAMVIAVLALAGCACSAQSSSSASGSMSASDISASASSATSGSSSSSSASSSSSSSAQPTLEAPNLVGMSMTDAQAVTDSLGLALEATGDLDGTITSQDPAAGTQVAQGSTMSVTVKDVSIWTDAPSAGEAAQAAGVDYFNVSDSVTMGSNSYSNPKFSYTAGAVQALYDGPASGVSVRKTDAAHVSLATDRDLSDFSLNWTQDVDGTEVTCFGDAQDAATVIELKVGADTYAATYQGYGGEEMTMSSDDIADLIAGIE